MQNSSLFDDQNDLLLLVYNICSPICFFLNTLAIYLIIFKSTNEMKMYRWHLLIYQIWASAIDIFFNCLFQPIMFFPLISVAGHGILITKFGISTITCLYILVNLQCALAISIVDLFLFRHQCIVRNKLTKKQFYFCIFLQFSVLTFLINAFLKTSHVDPSHWSEILEKWNPKAVQILEIPNVYYFPHVHIADILIFITLTVLIFLGMFSLGLIYHMYYILRKDSKRFSISTRKMHRKFLVTLILQITAPTMFLFAPLVFIYIRILDGRLGLQILNNFVTIMMSSYGILATIFLIYLNDPYRIFLYGTLKKELCGTRLLYLCGR